MNTASANARTAALLLGLFGFLPSSAKAYLVSCSTDTTQTPHTFTATEINGVFGELRMTTGNKRFHAGTDIGNSCATGHWAFPIEAGEVIATQSSCGAPIRCIRVRGTSTGRIFDYVHVDYTVTALGVGSQVTVNTPLGTIQPGGSPTWGNHLHLNQITSGFGFAAPYYRVNAQFPIRLTFTDSDLPAFDTFSLGAVTNRSVIVTEDGTTTPFRLRNNTQYIRGDADIYIAAGTSRGGAPYRKGLYMIKTNAIPVVSLAASGSGMENRLIFNTLPDAGVAASQVAKIYYAQQTNSNIDIQTNLFTGPNFGNVNAEITADGAWATDEISDGSFNICPTLQTYPNGPSNGQTCISAYVDNTAPTITMTNSGGTVTDGGATSTATITISPTDPGGIYSITVAGVSYSSTNYPSGVQTSPSNTFPDSSVLADGSYTATVVDLAGNSTSSGFQIFTGTPSPDAKAGSDSGSSVTNPITNNDCIVLKDTSGVGISELSSSINSNTAVYTVDSSTAIFALVECGVSTGTKTIVSKNRAGKVGTKSITISSAPVQETLAGSGASWSASNSVAVGGMSTLQASFLAVTGTTSCDIFSVTVNGTELNCHPQCGGCAVEYGWASGPPAQTFNWNIRNKTSSTTYSDAIVISGGVSGYNNQIIFNGAPHPYQLGPGASIGGSATIPAVSNATYTFVVSGSTLSVASPYAGVTLSTRTTLSGAEEAARLRQVLRRSGYAVDILADGGAAVFNSTMTLRLEYADAAIDTTTARIYRLSGTAWESSSMFNQTFSRSGNDITAVGLSTFTSTFVVFFDGQDSSAPVTTFAIQGSSFVFDQALFVSMDAFVVLTATDPAVNGYASTVASITSRIDPSSNSPFYIYSSSIPLPLGTHVFEYRSLDYAGNTESIKTATFTVTAGTALRTTNTAQIPGVLLNGFLGSGAKLEIESQAQNSLTLLISSANREGMVAVDNIGEVGIGVTPQANLNIGQGSIALQLRSGNSTSAVTSNQIAFGYNGDSSMRHLLRTEHSTSTHGNKLDFLVWNTGAGSTTTLASLNVLSLQGIAAASGGSFHVQPVGEPDAEVEVSNGLSTGGGTMQRLQVVAPSSRRFKTDIKDLSAKDEDRALEDVSGLKHARFRYKSRQKDGRLTEDPAQTLHTGLIYEEAPASIREGGEALSTSERLVNVELALKAEMRRLEELQKRYEKLKARRTTP